MKKIKTVLPPKRHHKEKDYRPPSLDSWLPNWKNAQEYEWMENAEDKQFAWEFLRRNTHYRAMREALTEKYADNPKLLDKATEELSLVRNNVDDLEVSGSNEKLEPFTQTLNVFHREFGILNFPPDPSKDYLEISCELVQIASGQNINNEKLYFSENKVALIFDINDPTSIILKDIKAHLKRIKKKRKISESRLQRKLFPKYLRTLDAYLSGYYYMDISEVLYANQLNEQSDLAKKVESNIKSAREYVDGKYKFLAV